MPTSLRAAVLVVALLNLAYFGVEFAVALAIASVSLFADSIDFLEDTAVKPYQIDRMLWQLCVSGSLDGVRGLVFGEMPGCEQHPSQGYALDDVLRDATAGLKVPVLSGFPSGHCLAPAMTLPLGVRASLDHDGLTLLEGAVV